MQSFHEFGLSEELLKSIEELQYKSPTPIQEQAIPVLLEKTGDFMGLAATGTGKTAAFSIPLLERIDPTKKEVQGLILCPTRELAVQVAGQIDLLGKHKKIKALPVYGGASYIDQIHGLSRGAMIVVGTPGRVIDHINRGTLKLGTIKTLILDEADEMISMGFKEDLETILETVPKEDCRIWLFSATMSPEVRRVADSYLRNPRQIQVNRNEMLSSTVKQICYAARESDKPEILCKLIEAADDFYGLIFCQTKTLVSNLSQFLSQRGYKVDSLHGDKDQKAREKTMAAFRNRNISILICTDVASRGLDVKDVTHVINYSIPKELDLYVHRIGRTARSGKAGLAMSLVSPSHRYLISRIEKMTKSKISDGVIPTRREIGLKRIEKIMGQFQEEKNHIRVVELLNDDLKAKISSMDPQEIAGRFIGMLAADVFKDKESKSPLLDPSASRDEDAPRKDSSRRHKKFFGGGGRKSQGRRSHSPHKGHNKGYKSGHKPH